MASKEIDNENPEDSRDSAGGVGAMLKASRLRLGDDLRFVAETLHIRFIYLEAIEASRYEILPGAAYAIGFIRSYADYLGLDSDEVVRRYKSESSGGSGETRLVFPVPIPESSIPGGAIIFVGVVIALLTYGVWYVSTAKDGFLAGLVSPVPERLSEQSQPEESKFTPTPNIPEVAEKEDVTTTVEQVVAETKKEVSQAAGDVAEQAVSEATSEVVEKVEETAQVVVAEVVEKVAEVTAAAEESQPVAPEVDVSAVQPVIEPAASASEDVAPNMPVAPEPEVSASEPVVAQSADLQAPLKAVAEEPQPVPEIAAEPVVETPVETPVEPVVEAPAETPAETAVEAVVEPTPEPAPAAAATTQVYGSENINSRILVKARKNSWIQVRDNNANRLLLTRLLRAGDSYRVPDQPGLVLLTGNAGALEILVDGKAVPDLGGAGKVRRDVAMDPDLLRQGKAAN